MTILLADEANSTTFWLPPRNFGCTSNKMITRSKGILLQSSSSDWEWAVDREVKASLDSGNVSQVGYCRIHHAASFLWHNMTIPVSATSAIGGSSGKKRLYIPKTILLSGLYFWNCTFELSILLLKLLELFYTAALSKFITCKSLRQLLIFSLKSPELAEIIVSNFWDLPPILTSGALLDRKEFLEIFPTKFEVSAHISKT